MTSSQEPTGVLRRLLRRLHRNEAGQGLVEYALIIVVVSLGSLVALNFLSDEVSNLFNKAGSSIREGAGTGSSGGGTPVAPAVAGVTLGNGGVAGRVDSGDTITITFSAPVTAASICPGWDGTIGNATGESIGVNHDNDPEVLTFDDGGSGCDPQIGDVELTANYLSNSPRNYGATMSLGGATGTTLVVTFTSSGAGGNPNTIGSPSTATFDPDGSILGVSGLAIVNVDFSIPSALHF